MIRQNAGMPPAEHRKELFMNCHIEISPRNNTLDFSVVCGNDRYYLFSQKYSRSVLEHFRRNARIDQALDHTRSNRNTLIVNAIGRLYSSLKYVDKYYSLDILKKGRQTSRRQYIPAIDEEF